MHMCSSGAECCQVLKVHSNGSCKFVLPTWELKHIKHPVLKCFVLGKSGNMDAKLKWQKFPKSTVKMVSLFNCIVCILLACFVFTCVPLKGKNHHNICVINKVWLGLHCASCMEYDEHKRSNICVLGWSLCCVVWNVCVECGVCS